MERFSDHSFFAPVWSRQSMKNSVYVCSSQNIVQLREGDGTRLQYSCMENPMDRGAWWAAVHGVARSRKLLSDFTFTFHFHALEKENGNPLQCSCLENPRNGRAWWAAVYGVAQSRTRLTRLSSSSSSRLHRGLPSWLRW